MYITKFLSDTSVITKNCDKNSYKILAPKAMDGQKDPKKACGVCLDAVNLDEELYRLGNTKACHLT